MVHYGALCAPGTMMGDLCLVSLLLVTWLITDKGVESLTCPSQLVSPPTAHTHKCSAALPPMGERQCELSSCVSPQTWRWSSLPLPKYLSMPSALQCRFPELTAWGEPPRGPGERANSGPLTGIERKCQEVGGPLLSTDKRQMRVGESGATSCLAVYDCPAES